jgi:hypothetical protein
VITRERADDRAAGKKFARVSRKRGQTQGIASEGGRGAVVRCAEGHDGFDDLVPLKMLDPTASDEAPFAMPDEVKGAKAVLLCQILDFIGYQPGDVVDRAGVVPTQQTAEVKAQHAVSVSPQPLFHNLEDRAGLEKAVQKEHVLLEVIKVAARNNSVSPQVDATNTSKLAF